MTLTRAQIVAAARSWIGTAYLHQACKKGLACDCIGLIRGVGGDLGICDPSDSNPAWAPFLPYGTQPDPLKMKAALEAYLEPIARRQAAAGDIVWIKFDDAPRHVGILSGAGSIIHALSTVGRVAEHRLDLRWAGRVVAAWRFPGIA